MDLGSMHFVSRVMIRNSQYPTVEFKLSISADKNTWQEALPATKLEETYEEIQGPFKCNVATMGPARCDGGRDGG